MVVQFVITTWDTIDNLWLRYVSDTHHLVSLDGGTVLRHELVADCVITPLEVRVAFDTITDTVVVIDHSFVRPSQDLGILILPVWTGEL